ncbi:MAG: 6,7-dimethyl-8-ribityllumazine synthase [Cyanobacteria bacterium P01_H01_bin.119]
MAIFEGSFTSDIPLRFAIVIGRFNDLVTGKLLAGCQDCLKRHGVDVNPDGAQVDYAWVPGSFEVPLVARQLAVSGRYNAVICLGAVIRGSTPHFDYVAAEVSKGVAAASLQTGVPVVFGVLTTDTLQQALERAGIKSNLGWSYGMSALEMATLMHQIRQVPSASQTNGLAGYAAPQQLPGASVTAEKVS